ncbi:hypothetical protein THAOC_32516 [Thalassiosira oceanica]|uniref:Uncharacterized protein n=1 Tax=Thalassiosira oceanica TaxID=159749 RepID=K0RIG8_THAOC|nr:hypothetical protein THAOC_32516 [Thalassiosira oceanica]|eukprot:EJK48666.1 hypothetical protein THAOC_32516 [Thalassiosira oceanica]
MITKSDDEKAKDDWIGSVGRAIVRCSSTYVSRGRGGQDQTGKRGDGGLSAAALLGSLLGLPYNRAIVNTANSVSFLGKVPPTLVSTAHELLPWEGLGGRLYPTHCLSSATSAVPSTVAPVDLSIQ